MYCIADFFPSWGGGTPSVKQCTMSPRFYCSPEDYSIMHYVFFISIDVLPLEGFFHFISYVVSTCFSMRFAPHVLSFACEISHAWIFSRSELVVGWSVMGTTGEPVFRAREHIYKCMIACKRGLAGIHVCSYVCIYVCMYVCMRVQQLTTPQQKQCPLAPGRILRRVQRAAAVQSRPC